MKITALDLIADWAKYDAKKERDERLADDWRWVCNFYKALKEGKEVFITYEGKKTKLTMEMLLDMATNIVKERLDRGFEFHPGNMESHSLELYNKILDRMGKEARLSNDELEALYGKIHTVLKEGDMPLPNFHACRLLDPDLFKTCRTTKRESDGKEYSVLTCQYKKTPEGKSDWAEQSYRYDRKVWTVQAAKNHCDKQETGWFEPAATELNAIDLTVIGSKTLPVDDRYEWDGDAAVERMRILASSDGSGDKDKVNFESYKRGFLFRTEDVKNFGSYKLPFADVIDGKLMAVWGGIARALGALMGARTPVAIPDRYKRGCYNVLAVYYKKLDKDLPPFHLAEKHKYFFASPVSLKEGEHLMDIEILRQGEWAYAKAPGGMLTLPKEKLEEFVQNFEDKVVGEDLPLDIDHKPSKTGAVGWLKKMWLKSVDGLAHLWATLDITDPEIQKAVKERSLKYFSPSLEYGWIDPESGKLYDLIRSGALTNWPFIKNMKPAVVNFSEIQGGEQKMITEKELEKREESLETKETELKDRVEKLDTREVDVKAKEKEISERPGFFHDLPEGDAVKLGNEWKAGDEKAYETLIKLATTRLMAELKLVGIEDLPQFDSKGDAELDPKTEARLKELEKGNKAKDATIKTVVDQLQAVNSELREEKVEAKLNDLGIAPAKRELLKGIMMAEKDGKIQLIEEKDGKKIEKKLSIGDAVVELISGDTPLKVDLKQQSILTGRSTSSVSLREGVMEVLGLSQEQWDKLPEEQRETFLKRVSGEK